MWDNYNLGWLDSEAERQGGSSSCRLRDVSLSQKPAPSAPNPTPGLNRWSHLAHLPSGLSASTCFKSHSDMLAMYLIMHVLLGVQKRACQCRWSRGHVCVCVWPGVVSSPSCYPGSKLSPLFSCSSLSHNLGTFHSVLSFPHLKGECGKQPLVRERECSPTTLNSPEACSARPGCCCCGYHFKAVKDTEGRLCSGKAHHLLRTARNFIPRAIPDGQKLLRALCQGRES